MNFLDAVRELSDGRCKEIRELICGNVYKSHGTENKLTCVNDPGHVADLEEYLGNWTIINPIPQTEEVIIEQWWCPNCSDTYDSQGVCPVSGCYAPLIKLTGTIIREKKRQVKRREEVKPINSYELLEHAMCKSEHLSSVKFYAEWMEDAP